MFNHKLLFFVLFIFMGSAVSLMADPKGDEAIQKYYQRAKPQDVSSIAEVTLFDKNGNTKYREFKMSTKTSSRGYMLFIEVLKPADVAGTKMLVIPTNDGGTEQRLFLPILKKVRKIALSDRSGEFVNSDFSYFDLEDKQFKDGTYVLLGEGETLSEPEFSGMKFDKIEETFKSSTAPYNKAILWVNATDHELYKMDCYDRKDGQLFKTFLFTKFLRQGAQSWHITYSGINHKKGSRTLIEYKNVVLNAGLSDSDFSVQKLEK